MMDCEHEWKWTYGVDTADMIIAAKICIKCHEIINLGYPGIDEIPTEWYDSKCLSQRDNEMRDGYLGIKRDV